MYVPHLVVNYLSRCDGQALLVHFFNVLAEISEVWNHELVLEGFCNKQAVVHQTSGNIRHNIKLYFDLSFNVLTY